MKLIVNKQLLHSHFKRLCLKNVKKECKICKVCPFRKYVMQFGRWEKKDKYAKRRK